MSVIVNSSWRLVWSSSCSRESRAAHSNCTPTSAPCSRGPQATAQVWWQGKSTSLPRAGSQCPLSPTVRSNIHHSSGNLQPHFWSVCGLENISGEKDKKIREISRNVVDSPTALLLVWLRLTHDTINNCLIPRLTINTQRWPAQRSVQRMQKIIAKYSKPGLTYLAISYKCIVS